MPPEIYFFTPLTTSLPLAFFVRCAQAPREWCYMPINENELLELNADLMVLIREKQEQGALADAVR